jgi:hypothetical protein
VDFTTFGMGQILADGSIIKLYEKKTFRDFYSGRIVMFILSNLFHQSSNTSKLRFYDVLLPVRNWIEGIEIKTPDQAKELCRLIPAQCPFERDIQLFGRTLFHIPPLCKLNPFYEQLVFLRFRALCFLADECGEDVSAYC